MDLQLGWAAISEKQKYLIKYEGKVCAMCIVHTVFPQIRPKGIIFLHTRVLLEITEFHLNKSVPDAGIIRNAGII